MGVGTSGLHRMGRASSVLVQTQVVVVLLCSRMNDVSLRV